MGSGRTQQSGAPQDIPIAGAFIRRVVRGDTGELLSQARDQRVSEEAAGILKKAGVRYEPGMMRREVGSIPLKTEELTAHQTTANGLVNDAIKKVARLPEWESATVDIREEMIRMAVADARAQAKTVLLNKIGVDEAIRRATDPAEKADLELSTVPHYKGVSGTKDEIRRQNAAIRAAKSKLADYKKRLDPDPGERQLRIESPDTLALARREDINQTWLKRQREAIDRKYNGAMTARSELRATVRAAP